MEAAGNTMVVDAATGEIIEGEIVEEPTIQALVSTAPRQGITTLFGTDDPNKIIASATIKADALAKVIESRELYTNIQGKKHVRIEGWQLLGSLLGVFPSVSSRPLFDTEGLKVGWEATCEARTMEGVLVGSADSQCTTDEKRWDTAPDYAVRSMAQTRATSKALRLALGFVMSLAGFDTTPAEEMDGVHHDEAPKKADEASLRQKKALVEEWKKQGVAEVDMMARTQELVGEPKVEGKRFSKGQVGSALKHLRDLNAAAAVDDPGKVEHPEGDAFIASVEPGSDPKAIVTDLTWERLEAVYGNEAAIWAAFEERWGSPEGAITEAAALVLIEARKPGAGS